MRTMFLGFVGFHHLVELSLTSKLAEQDLSEPLALN
jgi:hypothetical protein